MIYCRVITPNDRLPRCVLTDPATRTKFVPAFGLALHLIGYFPGLAAGHTDRMKGLSRLLADRITGYRFKVIRNIAVKVLCQVGYRCAFTGIFIDSEQGRAGTCSTELKAADSIE